MMLHTKYQGSRPCSFRQEDFFMFLPILVYVKHVTPGAGSFLKYQSSRPYGFRQEDFFMILSI